VASVTTPDGPNWTERDVAARAGVSVELLHQLRDRGIVDAWDERAVGRARLIDAWIRADVYGATVNLASRIASFAEGGTVVVSGTTVAAIGDRHVPDASDPSIRFEPLGAVALKGVPRDVPLFQATVDPVRLG
jgi:hypothetical protein